MMCLCERILSVADALVDTDQEGFCSELVELSHEVAELEYRIKSLEK